MSEAILEVDDVVRGGMLLVRHDYTDTTDVVTTNNHGHVTHDEFMVLNNLVGSQVKSE